MTTGMHAICKGSVQTTGPNSATSKMGTGITVISGQDASNNVIGTRRENGRGLLMGVCTT
jgi:hypothetical protein